MAFLHCTDSANSAKQKEFKGKDVMILCVLNFLSSLAERVAQPNGEDNSKAPPAQPSDDDCSDGVSLASESERYSEEKTWWTRSLQLARKEETVNCWSAGKGLVMRTTRGSNGRNYMR